MTDFEIYAELVKRAETLVPGVKVGFKTEDRVQKLIGALMFFNPAYMTTYTTTWFGTVFYPNKDFLHKGASGWTIFAHELVHLVDSKKHPIRFFIEYAMPQGLAVLALLAPLGLFFPPLWGFALALLAAAPWPSPGRTKWEARGYTATMAIEYWQHGKISQFTKDWMISSPFTGWGYYKMGWSKAKATSLVDSMANEVISGRILDQPEYKMTYDLLVEAQRVHTPKTV